jgi:hypothetical protein
MILRIYSKTIGKKKKVRIEIQQNPSIFIEELKKSIIEKILNNIPNNNSKTSV